MRPSKKRIDKNVERQIFDLFYQVVADIRSLGEAETFLKALLTKTELEAQAKRLAVARLLEKGQSYYEIKKSLKVSSATVASVADQLKKSRGFSVALKKIQADEWADRWAKKINQMMSKKP